MGRLVFLLMFLFSFSAFAGFQGFNGTTDLKIFNAIKCSTGLTCTKVGDKFTIVSSPTISTGSLTITAADTVDATLLLNADNADDDADKWKIAAEASGDAFNLLNKTSGAYVSKFKVSTAGDVTLGGGLVASSGQFTNYGRAYDGLTTGTSTTPSATVVYLSQVFVSANATITGIKVNSGATVGTNKYLVALFDSTGAAVATSALAGVTTANADAYQTIAFTGTYAAKGPGVYWIGLYVNGTTDRFRSLAAGAEGKGLAGSVTGQTFGTVASVTLPTTFTADKGPVAFLY